MSLNVDILSDADKNKVCAKKKKKSLASGKVQGNIYWIKNNKNNVTYITFFKKKKNYEKLIQTLVDKM